MLLSTTFTTKNLYYVECAVLPILMIISHHLCISENLSKVSILQYIIVRRHEN